jgi:Flp pilus assembly CpaF family ATPase
MLVNSHEDCFIQASQVPANTIRNKCDANQKIIQIEIFHKFERRLTDISPLFDDEDEYTILFPRTTVADLTDSL